MHLFISKFIISDTQGHIPSQTQALDCTETVVRPRIPRLHLHLVEGASPARDLRRQWRKNHHQSLNPLNLKAKAPHRQRSLLRRSYRDITVDGRAIIVLRIWATPIRTTSRWSRSIIRKCKREIFTGNLISESVLQGRQWHKIGTW